MNADHPEPYGQQEKDEEAARLQRVTDVRSSNWIHFFVLSPERNVCAQMLHSYPAVQDGKPMSLHKSVGFV